MEDWRKSSKKLGSPVTKADILMKTRMKVNAMTRRTTTLIRKEGKMRRRRAWRKPTRLFLRD